VSRAKLPFHLASDLFGLEKAGGTPCAQALARPRIREIGNDDIETIVNLITHAFRQHRRTRDFWVRAFKRLSEHVTPAGFPKYGYCLDYNGAPVGVILLIFCQVPDRPVPEIRCNVSTWYVEPQFRGYAAMLVTHALKHKGITYTNITPMPHTFPILKAQGFLPYCAGRVVAFPALTSPVRGCIVSEVGPETCPANLTSSEAQLLVSHAGYGCLSVVCSADGRGYPFIFIMSRTRRLVPYAYLAYCRDLEEFVRFSGSLGRFLARRGLVVTLVDTNGPLRDVCGRYSEPFPKFFRGPNKPRLGDVAYSERALFGF
jgi:hypothetical protein